jgi:hypothetical protein
MASHHPGAAPAPDSHLVPPILATWLAVFRPCFTAPVWNRVLVLVAGAVLAPGKRTLTQVLRGGQSGVRADRSDPPAREPTPLERSFDEPSRWRFGQFGPASVVEQ